MEINFKDVFFTAFSYKKTERKDVIGIAANIMKGCAYVPIIGAIPQLLFIGIIGLP